jgi:hypothetical protein
MPSPFPGMNPYLEQRDVWQDFHNDFLGHIREALVRQTNDAYVVKLETRLVLEEIDSGERAFIGRADVGISGGYGGGIAVAEPMTTAVPLQLPLPEFDVSQHHYLEILDHDRRVVTVIELLSPANKETGSDLEGYQAKRLNVMRSKAHFVEIDLRRGGRRPTPPEIPACDYYALVSRCEDRPRFCSCWPFSLRGPIPQIPIPLNHPDPDVLLDLKSALDRTYDAAGYARYIYRENPEPALSTADDQWARDILASAVQNPAT